MTNEVPVLIDALAPRRVNEGVSFSFKLRSNAFSDSDGDQLTYSVANADGGALPAWLVFDAATRTFSGNAPDRAPNLTLRVSASDGNGGTATGDFVLTTNAPPVSAGALPSRSVTEARAFSFTIPTTSFKDADRDNLTYSARLADGSRLPRWLRFDPRTRTFSGRAPIGAADLTLRVTVSDGNGGSATSNFRLTTAGISGSVRRVATGPAGPKALVTGDLNGDGDADLVTANDDGNTLSLMLGGGNGTFRAPRSLNINGTPKDVVVGDFNGDRKLDLLGMHFIGGHVLLGNGDGTFRTLPRLPLVITTSVATADFNGDGKLDAVFSTTGQSDDIGKAMVLLGRGDGSFQAERFYAVGRGPDNVIAADVNRDRRADVITLNSTQVEYTRRVSSASVLLNRGDGTFSTQRIVSLGDNAVDLLIADLNRDGIPDMASGHFGDPRIGGDVEVRLGRGDGTYGAARRFAAGVQPLSLATADVNRDGKADIISVSHGSTSLMLGLGRGRFAAPTVIRSGNDTVSWSGGYTSRIATADWNGDGRPDVVVAPPNNGAAYTVMFGHAPITPASLPDRRMTEGAATSFTVAAFTDADGDRLTYAARRANGRALPAWLRFDAATRTFSGTAPVESADIVVRVTATDQLGLRGKDDFVIATVSPSPAPAPVVSGRIARNTLTGGMGENELWSRSGKDVMVGGDGADRFCWTAPSDGTDVISDFSRRDGDKLVFMGSGFPGLSAGVLQNARLSANDGGAASDRLTRFLFDTSNGLLQYDPDGTGAAAPTTIAKLNVRSLSASDIMISAG